VPGPDGRGEETERGAAGRADRYRADLDAALPRSREGLVLGEVGLGVSPTGVGRALGFADGSSNRTARSREP